MKRMNQKGTISFFFIFVFLAIIFVFLFAVITPMLIQITTTMYASSETMLDNAYTKANTLTDASIKAEMTSAIDSARDTMPTQVAVLSEFYKYGFIIIIFITLLILFLLTRQTVEQQKAGGVY